LLRAFRLLLQEAKASQFLLEYPGAQLPDATSFLYWHKVNFGLKPTIMINHVVITETPQPPPEERILGLVSSVNHRHRDDDA
jgi:hypothetical protein